MPARRFSRYAPLVLWLCVILIGSSATMSASETSRFIAPLLRWLFPDISSETSAFIHIAIRKTAHVVEYAALALLAARAFLTSSKTHLRRHWFGASLALVIVCSLLDEYHQSLISSRTGTIYDSLLDTAGGLTALTLLLAARIVRRKLPGGVILAHPDK